MPHATSADQTRQVAEDQHVQRCRAETVAMKAEPMKRYLMQQLMPVLAKAMVDAKDQHVPNPVQFVAEQLLEVSLHTNILVPKRPGLYAAA